MPPAQLLNDLQSLPFPVRVRQHDEGTFLGQVAGVDTSVFRYAYRSWTAPSRWNTARSQRATKRETVDLHAFAASTPGLPSSSRCKQKPHYDPAHSTLAFGQTIGRDEPMAQARYGWEIIAV